MSYLLKRFILTAFVVSIFIEVDPVLLFAGKIGPADAQARVGRPATPRSVAGVARRTTRRTIRRGRYYAALPGGCVRTTVYGYSVYQCGGVYYQASGSGYVIVTFY